jgi:hypothetical protein
MTAAIRVTRSWSQQESRRNQTVENFGTDSRFGTTEWTEVRGQQVHLKWLLTGANMRPLSDSEAATMGTKFSEDVIPLTDLKVNPGRVVVLPQQCAVQIGASLVAIREATSTEPRLPPRNSSDEEA